MKPETKLIIPNYNIVDNIINKDFRSKYSTTNEFVYNGFL